MNKYYLNHLFKWTIFLNFLSSLFILGLILVPQKLEDDSGDASNPSNFSDDAVCGYGADTLQNGTVWAPIDNASFCCSIFYNNVSEVQGSFNFESGTFEGFFNSLVDVILVRVLK